VVKTKFVSMVNVLADREVVPEYIQSDLDPSALAQRAASLLGDAAQRNEIRKEMRRVVEKLGKPGASERAARLILDQIGAPVEKPVEKASEKPAGKAAKPTQAAGSASSAKSEQ